MCAVLAVEKAMMMPGLCMHGARTGLLEITVNVAVTNDTNLLVKLIDSKPLWIR